MGAAILIELDRVAAEQDAGPDGQSLDAEGVRDHDPVIRSFIGKIGAKCCPGGVESVTDDLPEHIPEAEGRARNAGFPVMIWRHTVVDMGDAAGAVGKSHGGLGTGRGGVPERSHDPVLIQEAGQAVSLIMLTGQRHDPDQTVRSRKIPLELVHIRLDAELFRLGALIGPVKIGPFKMDPQDLRARDTFRILPLLPGDLSDILQGFGQYLFGLGDGRGENAGHPLADDLFQPVFQPLLLCVVRIKPVGAVRVNIDQAGDHTQTAKIHVRDKGPARVYSLDPSGFRRDLDLGLQPVIQYPHSCALQDHPFFSFFKKHFPEIR